MNETIYQELYGVDAELINDIREATINKHFVFQGDTNWDFYFDKKPTVEHSIFSNVKLVEHENEIDFKGDLNLDSILEVSTQHEKPMILFSLDPAK